MKHSGNSGLHFLWDAPAPAHFTTGVSLHSHTLLSHELLDFIHRTTRGIPWLSGAIRSQRERYREIHGAELDFARAWWTPPLAPVQAHQLEADQIAKLGLRPLVSLSDHDDIGAGMQLQVLNEHRDSPVSTEWTVPFGQTFFHIGVHNLPAAHAPEMAAEMARATASGDQNLVREIFEQAASWPETLIIFNHPAWDENHIGAQSHQRHVEGFLRQYGDVLHAVELNGLRPWKENRLAAKIAEAAGLPLISGGDRHGREPNACINLTSANTFAGFVSEVRDGYSQLAFLPHYRESLRLRLLENLSDILRDDPDHALGWTRWSDRVFYRTEAGDVRSLSQLWTTSKPAVVSQFVALVGLTRIPQIRFALRAALAERPNFVL